MRPGSRKIIPDSAKSFQSRANQFLAAQNHSGAAQIDS